MHIKRRHRKVTCEDNKTHPATTLKSHYSVIIFSNFVTLSSIIRVICDTPKISPETLRKKRHYTDTCKLIVLSYCIHL